MRADLSAGQEKEALSLPAQPGVPTPCTLHPASDERRGHGGAEEGRAAARQRRPFGGEGAGEEAAARRGGRDARWQLLSPARAEQPGAVAGQTVRLGGRPRRRRRSPARRDERRSGRGHHFLGATLRGGRQLPEGRSGGGGGGRGEPATAAAAGQLLERGDCCRPWHRLSRCHLWEQRHPVPGQL